MLKPKPTHKTGGDIAVFPVSFDNGDLHQIAGGIGALVAILRENFFGQKFGDDLARQNTNHRRLGAVAGGAKHIPRD